MKLQWKKYVKFFIVETVISLFATLNIFGMEIDVNEFFEDLETEYNEGDKTYDTKPVQPSACLPLDEGFSFIADDASEKNNQKILSFSIYGTNHSYNLKGVWNDKGCHQRYLENIGLSRAEYIKRYGFNTNDKGEGTDIDGYNYLDEGENIILSEPEQFMTYQWCISDNGKNNSYRYIENENRNQLEISDPKDGRKYYHCEATINGSDQKYILGENYSVEYYRLPKAKGIMIREVI